MDHENNLSFFEKLMSSCSNRSDFSQIFHDLRIRISLSSVSVSPTTKVLKGVNICISYDFTKHWSFLVH